MPNLSNCSMPGVLMGYMRYIAVRMEFYGRPCIPYIIFTKIRLSYSYLTPDTETYSVWI